MPRSKAMPELPKQVRFITQRQGRSFTAHMLVTIAMPGVGKTERAAMRSAAEMLRDDLEDLIAEAMKRPEREPDSV